MDVVLGDTQLGGNVMLRVCHDDVMNFGNGGLYGDSDWPSRMGVVLQTFPFLHHVV